jgi:hypothetical protein
VNPQKLIGTAITLGTGLVVTKAISYAWKGITGHEPPQAIDDDGEISVVEVVIFAAVSAAAAALVKSFVERRTAKWFSPDAITKG